VLRESTHHVSNSNSAPARRGALGGEVSLDEFDQQLAKTPLHQEAAAFADHGAKQALILVRVLAQSKNKFEC
jgi:hypothetical protein